MYHIAYTHATSLFHMRNESPGCPLFRLLRMFALITPNEHTPIPLRFLSKSHSQLRTRTNPRADPIQSPRPLRPPRPPQPTRPTLPAHPTKTLPILRFLYRSFKHPLLVNSHNQPISFSISRDSCENPTHVTHRMKPPGARGLLCVACRGRWSVQSFDLFLFYRTLRLPTAPRTTGTAQMPRWTEDSDHGQRTLTD